MAHRKRKDALVWGVILIAIGIIFLLEQFGIDAWDITWKFWPVILIIWGISKLLAGLQEKPAQPGETKSGPPPQV